MATLSVFPNNIPAFPVHRNLLDDVDAEHINQIQYEVTGMANALGLNPQIYDDVVVPNISAPTGTVGSVLDIEPTPAPVNNSQIQPKDHGTVRARLDYIERGLQNHCFRLSVRSINITKSANILLRPRAIRMPNPPNPQDPFNMYNGTGVTLRKSGFWYISGYILVARSATAGSNNNGLYEGAVDREGSWTDGMDRQFISDNGVASITLNPRISGFFNRGERISLRLLQTSNVTQTVVQARLTGFMIREDPF